MKRLLITAGMLMICTPVMAQKATGVGVGVANSSSQSGALAISGQGGQGGNSSLTVNSTTPAVTTANINQRVETSGTSTIKNVPTVFAPGLSAAGLETCLGSVSGGAGVVGFGASFGTSIPDPGCNARLDARTLWSMGLKGAAVARLCLSADVYRSMPDICVRYLPQPPAGYVAPLVLSASSDGGPIEVIEGKTGRTRICNDYDAPGQRCRVWAGQRMAAMIPHKRPIAAPKAAMPRSAAKPSAAEKPAEAPAPVEPK